MRLLDSSVDAEDLSIALCRNEDQDVSKVDFSLEVLFQIDVGCRKLNIAGEEPTRSDEREKVTTVAGNVNEERQRMELSDDQRDANDSSLQADQTDGLQTWRSCWQDLKRPLGTQECIT
jgi:hypothetical protein